MDSKTAIGFFILFIASTFLGNCQDCKVTKKGKEYRGTLNVTASGIACQNWDSNYPHSHRNKKAYLPNAGLDLNYCRNPDSESRGPWCYTVLRSRRYEFCNIPFCSQVQKCTAKIDLVLIFEMGNGDPRSIKYAREFFQTLKKSINPSLQCVRLEFIFVWKDIEIMTSLNCEYDIAKCYSSAMERMNKLQGLIVGKAASKKSLLIQAIEQGQRHLFSEKNGARAEAAKMMVLVLSNPPVKGLIPTHDAVKDLQDMGVEIVTIGSGEGRKEKLERISLDQTHVFRVTSLRYLAIERIAERVASLLRPGRSRSFLPMKHQLDTALKSSPRQLKAQRSLALLKDLRQPCKYLVDIAFLVDASGSIKNDYQTELFCIQRIAATFGLSESGSRAGVIVFSSRNYIETAIPFNRYSNFKDFKEGVDQLPFHGYLTRIDLALKAANNVLFTKESGSRDNAAKILFLITDGRQNPDFESGERLSPSVEASKLHDRGIKIFSVGVGQKVNETELRLISRSGDRAFAVADFEQLVSDEFVKGASQKICNEAATLPETNTAAGSIKKNVEEKDCNKKEDNDGKGKCCGNQRKSPVYVNVFNQETQNTNNLLQQSKIDQSGHSNSIDILGFDFVDSSDDASNSQGEPILDILKRLAPKKIKPVPKENDNDDSFQQIN